MIIVGYFGGFLMLGGGAVAGSAGVILMAIAGLTIMVLGFLVIGVAVVYGFVTVNKQRSSPPASYPDVLVVARFAINEANEMVFQDFDPEDPDTKLYVHLKFPGGRNQEYRCPFPVFESCGEGMRGSAVVQGDWLGSFTAFRVQPQNPLVF